MRAVACGFLMGALVACGQSFTPGSVVEQLRVLGVRADPPEVRPGDSVLLTAFIADPKGEGREVTVTWASCIPPGVITNLLACTDSANLQPIGSGQTLMATTPADFLTSDPRGPTDHRSFFVVFIAKAGDETVMGFKEVVVSSRSQPPNQNPILGGITATLTDGGPPVTEVTAEGLVLLHADFDPASKETYPDEDGGTKTEEMGFSWFATAGTWDLNKTFDIQDNKWTAPAEAQMVQFWVVLHDDRNGTDWRTFTLTVQPAIGGM